MRHPLVIAHRGASRDEPENTVPAFRRAIELGADYVEFDVHVARDGSLVVGHDRPRAAHDYPTLEKVLDIDEEYTRRPFYGSRKMMRWLQEQGHQVGRHRVRRLMGLLGLEAVYPKPKLSQPGEGHKLYPYLLNGVAITRVNQVWSTDITYIRMAEGFVYVVAVMDWCSR